VMLRASLLYSRAVQRAFVTANGKQGDCHAGAYAQSTGARSPKAPRSRGKPGGKKGQKQKLMAFRQVSHGLYPAFEPVTRRPSVGMLVFAHAAAITAVAPRPCPRAGHRARAALRHTTARPPERYGD